jgi:hypothetical protein
MPNPVWIATALGLLGGLVLSYVLGKAIIPRLVAKSRHMPMLAQLALAGTVIALVPALLLSLLIGSAFGGAWGAHAFSQLGFRVSGTPVGLALGIALVFALVVVGGAAIAVILGKALIYYRNRNNRS